MGKISSEHVFECDVCGKREKTTLDVPPQGWERVTQIYNGYESDKYLACFEHFGGARDYREKRKSLFRALFGKTHKNVAARARSE